MKRSIAFAALLAIIAGLSAAAPASAQGCVEVNASVSPEQACPGSPVLVTASITNCGELMDRITVKISGVGEFAVTRSFKLGAGRTRTATGTVMVPASASPGSYTLTVDATSSNGGSDSQNLNLDVISCP